MKLIPLSAGHFAKVDDDDYEWLMQWKWSYDGNGYAVRYMGSRKEQVPIRMHRWILDTPKGVEVDHINMDGLDNRRINLRNCNRQENLYNRSALKNNKSGYKGVTLHKFGKWHARMKKGDKQVSLGYYETPEEAARAYDKAAVLWHGDFARLNKV